MQFHALCRQGTLSDESSHNSRTFIRGNFYAMLCVLCAVCPGGMYRQCFCSGLSMVMAVNVGDIWELLRLA